MARERHLALGEGDTELYASQDAALAALCAEFSQVTPLGPSDRAALEELISLEMQSSALLDALLSETSVRMESLRETSRANAAYLRSERFSVNGV